MSDDDLVTLPETSGFAGHQIAQLMRELASGSARRANSCNCADAETLPSAYIRDGVVRRGHVKDFGDNPDEDLALFVALLLGKQHNDLVMSKSTLYRVMGA